MKVELTPHAERHMQAIDAWWRANRSSASELFLEELAASFDALKSLPLTGHIVRVSGVRAVRRFLLRTTRHHVYYQVERDTVKVLAIWSAVRGRGPSPTVLLGARPRRRGKS